MKRVAATMAVAAFGCAGMSEYKRCRFLASLEKDPIARAVSQGNCEQVANRELTSNMYKERQQTTADEQRREQELELEREQRAREYAAAADQRRARENPKVPDIGATAAESKQLCERQRGQHLPSESEGGMKLICKVGGYPIYVAVVGLGEEAISMRKAFIEGGDVTELRDRLEGKMGPADEVQIVNGFRAWTWWRDGSVLVLSSYAAGVTVLTGIAPEDPEPKPQETAISPPSGAE